ncbi:MAG: CDGP domain-containing protein [Mycobacterium sp.]
MSNRNPTHLSRAESAARTAIMRHAAWTVELLAASYAVFAVSEQRYAEFAITSVLFLVAAVIDLWIHRRGRYRDRTAVALLVTFVAIMVAGVFSTPLAYADPGKGCDTVLWGFLGSQRRTLCDYPARTDGSWTRERIVWTPAHYVRGYCSGTYYITCYQGYPVGQSVQSVESYPVTPDTVLGDEPGHLAGAGVAA